MKKPLIKEPLRHFWTPDSQRLIAGGTITNRSLLIDDVAVDVVLNHVMRSVPPIVEDLRSEDVSPDAPDGLVALLGQPLVTQHLSVVVVYLERAVVYVARLVGAHEEGMVVDVVVAAVDVREDGHVLLRSVRLVDVQEVRRYEVEVFQVEVQLAGKVLYAQTIVAELRGTYYFQLSRLMLMHRGC